MGSEDDTVQVGGTGGRPQPPPVSGEAQSTPDRGRLASERYRLLEPLGRGGAGVVYAAHDTELDRRVAIRLLHG